MNYFAEARKAFYAGNMKVAMEQIDLAIKAMPKYSDVHQFRSLVLFVTKDYDQAAAAAHVALTAGPGWNWETVKALFPKAELYTSKLRELEEARNQNKQAPALRFLLAYHYLMLDHTEAAIEQLKVVVELEPRDQLSARLLSTISGESNQPTQPVTPVQPQQTAQLPQAPASNGAGLGALGNSAIVSQPEAPQQVEVKKVNPVETKTKSEKLVGQFKASPEAGVEFELVLNSDNTFKWTFKTEENTSSFAGTYTITDNELTLVRKSDGEKMSGIVTINKDGFNFKITGSDPQDPGLNFTT